MVEGPGCKVKGETIRSKLLKQSVKSVKGNAVDREVKNAKKKETVIQKGGNLEVAGTVFHRLHGHALDEVLTLGKELFMFFGTACLRIHFLMAGSFRINNLQVDSDGGKKIPASASLEIGFSKDTLTFYKCAAEIRPSSACRQKYLNLKDLDICSASFNGKQAVKEMMTEKDRLLCDVLLDQDVLPGVGNIIKNEALFDSGLKPDSKICELSEEHITHLVKMTRDFSMVFYKCRKNGTNLRQYMKVYQKGKCGECDTKIVMTRMGEDSERVTYFCPTCQTNDLKTGKLKLPSKNCLLGWVQVDQKQSATHEWACPKCTLLNPANQINCTVCLYSQNTPNKPVQKEQPQPIQLQSNHNHFPVKRKVQEEMHSPSFKKLKKETEKETENLPIQQQSKQDQLGNTSKTMEEVSLCRIPVCVDHRVQCAMRQTFKDNDNKGRWFFTCAVTPAKKRCKFFKWADEEFPICIGHGKVCALRTVMKQGPNNGRRFFCCPVRKSSCQFFEWATGYG